MKKDYIGEISDYIRKNLKKGYTLDSLRWALIEQGHSKMEVNKAIKRFEDELTRSAPILKTTPDITYDVVTNDLKSEVTTEASSDDKPWYKKIFGL